MSKNKPKKRIKIVYLSFWKYLTDSTAPRPYPDDFVKFKKEQFITPLLSAR